MGESEGFLLVAWDGDVLENQVVPSWYEASGVVRRRDVLGGKQSKKLLTQHDARGIAEMVLTSLMCLVADLHRGSAAIKKLRQVLLSELV